MEKATRRCSFAASMVLAAVVLLCVLAGTSAAAAGDTTRVSVASDGTEANQPSYGTTAFSADGRYVVFSSRASNLVPGDTNQERNGGPALDIFVRDRDADNDGVMDETDGPEATKTERVSVDSSGSEANGSSFLGSISADGRFVAFSSDANNLVPGDTNVDVLGNPASDIFVRDRQTGTTERVSVNSSETEANSYSSFSSISADGRFVAFSSNATNLAAGDTLLDKDIYVRDRQTGTTELVSVGAGNWDTYGSSISADGRYVAFFSKSPTLVSGDTNGLPDVFVRDLVNKTTERIRAECTTFSCSFQSTASISANGHYVAFESDASDLVVGETDTNGRPDVFVRDRQAGTTQRVSVAGCATEANGDSLSPRISSDGRYIAFPSSATNLVSDDTNGFGDVFVRDLVNKTIQRVSVGGSGTQANGGSGSTSSISISASGVYVAFGTSATNLVEGDTKGFDDIFVHERGNSTEPPSDCGAPITSRAISPQPNAAGWNNSDVSVTLNATDTGGSGVKEISYSIDGGAPTIVQQNSVQITVTNEGTTTISYHSTDKANNAEPQQTFAVKIDKTKPTVGSVTAVTGTAPNFTGATNYTAGDLTNKDVRVSWTCADNTGGSGPVNTSETRTFTSSGSVTPSCTDQAGNTASGSAFAVNIDKTKPKVSTATPTGTGVARSANATAAFSEKMDPTTITTSTFKLFRCSSTTSTNCATQITNVGVSLSPDRLTATLNPFPTNPTTLLASRTKFKVVVTTGAKDEAGNPLDQNATTGNQQMVWYFTT